MYCSIFHQLGNINMYSLQRIMVVLFSVMMYGNLLQMLFLSLMYSGISQHPKLGEELFNCTVDMPLL